MKKLTTYLLTFSLIGIGLTGCSEETELKRASSEPVSIGQSHIQVPTDAKITFDRPDVKTSAPSHEKKATHKTPAPKPIEKHAPTPVEQPPIKTEPKTHIQHQPSPEPVEHEPQLQTQTNSNSTIASTALSQVGVGQDCTALVEKSLAAVGVSTGNIAPAGFLALGTQVANPQPGDIAYYSDGGAGVPHVAVYVGNGQAVHGGWNGSTVVKSVDVGSGPTFIRTNA